MSNKLCHPPSIGLLSLSLVTCVVPLMLGPGCPGQGGIEITITGGDECPDDLNKTEPGICGCGVADVDTDGDGKLDCQDEYPNDPNKTVAGTCGCGVADTDSNGNGTADCVEYNTDVQTQFGVDAEGKSTLYASKSVAWGDLHSHTSYSNDAIVYNGCTATPADAVKYADQTARLDFVAITDHAEDDSPGMYTQENWNNMLNQEWEYEVGPVLAAQTAPRFVGLGHSIVIFPAFEYTKTFLMTSADHPVSGNGHRNFICYDYDHVPPRGIGFDELKHHICKDGTTDCWNDAADAATVAVAAGTKLNTPAKIWDYMNTYVGKDKYICIPHHSAKKLDKDEQLQGTNIDVRTDWDAVDSDVQTLVEIYSRHGSSEMDGADDDLEHVHEFHEPYSVAATLERWLSSGNDAYKLGIVGGTDTHDGNPGAVSESELEANGTPANIDNRLGAVVDGVDKGRWTGGLTAAWVTDANSRDQIWGSLRGRDCYATSGDRITLEFTAKMQNTLVPMGSTLTPAWPASVANQAGFQVNLHVRAVAVAGARITRIQVYRYYLSNSTVASKCFDTQDNTQWVARETASWNFTDKVTTNAVYRAKVWQNKVNGDLGDAYANVPYERAWSSPIWVAWQEASTDTPVIELQQTEP